MQINLHVYYTNRCPFYDPVITGMYNTTTLDTTYYYSYIISIPYSISESHFTTTPPTPTTSYYKCHVQSYNPYNPYNASTTLIHRYYILLQIHHLYILYSISQSHFITTPPTPTTSYYKCHVQSYDPYNPYNVSTTLIHR